MNDMTDCPVIPATDKIAAALAKAAAGIHNPTKNREVTVRSDKGNYKFKYATFDAILDAIRAPLTENGLWFVQTLEDNRMVTTLYHSSGQTIASRIPFVAGGNGPQAMGSALTYAKRYGLCALLGIAADEDDDANAAEGNSIEKSEPRKAQPQQKPISTPTDGPSVAERAHKLADDLIAGMDGNSLADVARMLMEVGLIDIDGDVWRLEDKSKLSGLKKLAPDQFGRVVKAYMDLTEKGPVA